MTSWFAAVIVGLGVIISIVLIAFCLVLMLGGGDR